MTAGPRLPPSYTLTQAHVAAHASALAVVCLDARSIGQRQPLHAERPGLASNVSIRADGRPVQWNAQGRRASEAGDIPSLTRVDILGPIAQRAEWVECEGYVDGHDAIAERMIAALEVGDVLAFFDSPGGVVAGGQEAIRSIAAAKAKHGRRITGWAGETIGSMATWYALCLCDELYLPTLGVIGSIGARGEHASIAVMLEKEGVAWTHFSAPGEGKIAFAPQLALSEMAKARATRDIWDCYLQFEADICAAPLGQALGLTPAHLRELDSDALIGQRAVDARLASGVSTLEAVTDYALTRAATSGDDMPPNEDTPEGKVAAPEDEPMKACAKCEASNPAASKFCADCGASMKAEEMPADEEEEEEMPASEKPAAIAPPKASRAAPRMSADLDLAIIVGAKGDSAPAIKSAALKMRATLDAVAKLVGARGHLDGDGILEGVALAIDDRNAAQLKARTYKTKAAEQQARSDARDRMDMLKDMADAKVYTRGELFVDVVKDGKRVGIKPAAEWSDDKVKGRSLENLRVHHGAKMAAAKAKPAAKSNPFEPVAKADKESPEVGALAAQSGLDSKALAQAEQYISNQLGGAS